MVTYRVVSCEVDDAVYNEGLLHTFMVREQRVKMTIQVDREFYLYVGAEEFIRNYSSGLTIHHDRREAEFYILQEYFPEFQELMEKINGIDVQVWNEEYFEGQDLNTQSL